jgi:hypothetical protein
MHTLASKKENNMNILAKSEEKILAVVTSIAENMQAGWDADNYEQFSESFTDGMKNVVNRDNYEKQRKRIFKDLGKHTKLEFVATHKNPGNFIVIWKLHCENRDLAALLSYIFVENEDTVLIDSATIEY